MNRFKGFSTQDMDKLFDKYHSAIEFILGENNNSLAYKQLLAEYNEWRAQHPRYTKHFFRTNG